MVNHAFILLPLYIYPLPGAWDPLFNAAKAYPSVTFQAVINPNSGPDGPCPNSDFINAMSILNTIPNIKTLGYVHTANRYNCGASGTDICTCTVPIDELQINIGYYQNWNTATCTTQDIHLDGLFIDESPGQDASCQSYMQQATTFAKNKLTRGNTVLFNAGTQVNDVYWSIADYINVFENSDAVYRTADIGALDQNGVQSQKSTLLIYSYAESTATLQSDVNTVLSNRNDAIAGLFLSDQNGYTAFGSNFNALVSAVATVVNSNNAAVKKRARSYPLGLNGA